MGGKGWGIWKERDLVVMAHGSPCQSGPGPHSQGFLLLLLAASPAIVTKLQYQECHLRIWGSISLETQNTKLGVVVHTGHLMA